MGLVRWIRDVLDDDDEWDAVDLPTYARNVPCTCEGGSVAHTPHYMDLCPECGGRVRYMSRHNIDIARMEAETQKTASPPKG